MATKDMIVMNLRFHPLLLLIIFALTACAGTYNPVPDFQSQPIATGQYAKRADHLVFIRYLP